MESQQSISDQLEDVEALNDITIAAENESAS